MVEELALNYSNPPKPKITKIIENYHNLIRVIIEEKLDPSIMSNLVRIANKLQFSIIENITFNIDLPLQKKKKNKIKKKKKFRVEPETRE